VSKRGRFSETATVQRSMLRTLGSIGWKYLPADRLDRGAPGRARRQVLREATLTEAIARLNPGLTDTEIASVITRIRTVITSHAPGELLEANRKMREWLLGREQVKTATGKRNVTLIDFDNPDNNLYEVTDEVPFEGTEPRRFDIVCWVNGIPLVVGETKTAVARELGWFDAATEIHQVYETECSAFFTPNVFSFATDGRELRYGAIRQEPGQWLPWGQTGAQAMPTGLEAVRVHTEGLLTPAMVLTMLRDLTLFTASTAGTGPVQRKLVARYPQAEAVAAIIERACDPERLTGLIQHHQGSGKTNTMALAAQLLVRTAALKDACVLVVVDRVDLVDQTLREFHEAGISTAIEAKTAARLQKILSGNPRGIIVTTVFRFKDSEVLTDRTNIVVLIDEAHRTQEGQVAADMRHALPKATFIGLTGTPVSVGDRDTYERFGHPDDPGKLLNQYTIEQSVSDGATCPVVVEARHVIPEITKDVLDAAIEQLAEDEGLDEEETDELTDRVATLTVLLKSPSVVDTVCRDIASHYLRRMRPDGFKAMVVAADREAAVLYAEKLQSIFGKEHVTAVISGGEKTKAAWSGYVRTRAQEGQVKADFRSPTGKLEILVVTAKLLTGFDAPICGVLYLVKAMRAHTLFQTICRPNRRWTSPAGVVKDRGLVVDYVGLEEAIVAALTPATRTAGRAALPDVNRLWRRLGACVRWTRMLFADVDRSEKREAHDVLVDAQQVLSTEQLRERLAKVVGEGNGLWEFLAPDVRLRPYAEDWKFANQVYESVTPQDGSSLLWKRLGPKVDHLVRQNVSATTIVSSDGDELALDAETIAVLRAIGLSDTKRRGSYGGPVSAEEVLREIEQRLEKKLSGGGPNEKVYRSLSEKLEALKTMAITSAAEARTWLVDLLKLARDVVAADKLENPDPVHAEDLDRLVPDRRKGTLSELLLACAPSAPPESVRRVVEGIDQRVVRHAAYSGWQDDADALKQVKVELRKVLKEQALPFKDGEPTFDNALAYIVENF
jgi:type I restriction enzyme, R subunit